MALVGSSCAGLTVSESGAQLNVTVTGTSPSEPLKVTLPFWQGSESRTTCVELPGVRVPWVGTTAESEKVLLATQLALTVEFAVSLSVTVHCMMEPLCVQAALVGSRLVGVTTSVACGAVI
jgi:hypothetical protein